MCIRDSREADEQSGFQLESPGPVTRSYAHGDGQPVGFGRFETLLPVSGGVGTQLRQEFSGAIKPPRAHQQVTQQLPFGQRIDAHGGAVFQTAVPQVIADILNELLQRLRLGDAQCSDVEGLRYLEDGLGGRC